MTDDKKIRTIMKQNAWIDAEKALPPDCVTVIVQTTVPVPGYNFDKIVYDLAIYVHEETPAEQLTDDPDSLDEYAEDDAGNKFIEPGWYSIREDWDGTHIHRLGKIINWFNFKPPGL